jgi:hypothetical protein
MSRLLRVLVVSFAISALAITAAMAGPGRDADGDPDVPMNAQPKTPSYQASDDGGSLAAPRAVQSGQVGERHEVSWRVALKVYLKLARVIAR